MNTTFEYLSDLFDSIANTTGQNSRFRLFFGAFADNLSATSTVAELAVQYYKEHGKIPDRKSIVEMYYGEYIEKANIFIGFDRLTVFDYPLINWGEEDLYFTIAPSLYLDKTQLRRILFDHLYTRRTPEREYETMTREEYLDIQEYYRNNTHSIIGIGKISGGVWIPSD